MNHNPTLSFGKLQGSMNKILVQGKTLKIPELRFQGSPTKNLLISQGNQKQTHKTLFQGE